jgi:L-asparaginase
VSVESVSVPAAVRPVRILAAGGTIAMSGAAHATPRFGAEALVAAVPALAGRVGLEARDVRGVPSTQLTLADMLDVCRAARDAAREGFGVVVTHGTDTLEETAMLCDVLHDAPAPIVFTGAMRSATATGADGPANLLDAVAVAESEGATGLGTLVVFSGEIHHARCARKTDASMLAAFGSPQTGPIGRVVEGRADIWSSVPRSTALDPPDLDRRVFVVPATSGDDGALARAALAAEADGVVVVTLGGGHLPPALLALWAEAAERIPIVACSRPERGAILRTTYGYAGSERELRASAIVPAGFLSPQAARVKLLAALACGSSLDDMRALFSIDDR